MQNVSGFGFALVVTDKNMDQAIISDAKSAKTLSTADAAFQATFQASVFQCVGFSGGAFGDMTDWLSRMPP